MKNSGKNLASDTPAAGAGANVPLGLVRVAQDLDGVLSGLTGAYELLARSLDGHRDAVRRADAKAMSVAARGQSEAIRGIAEMEQRRRRVINDATAVITIPLGARALTISDLARHIPEPMGSGLRRRATALRALIEETNKRQITLRTAAASLLAHVEGVARNVGRQLSHAGTYSARGRVEAGATVGPVGGLDLKT